MSQLGYDAMAAHEIRIPRTLRRVVAGEDQPIRSRIVDIVIGAAIGTAFGVFVFQPLARNGVRMVAEKFPRVGRVIGGGQ